MKNSSSTGAPNAVAGQAAAANTWYHVVLSYDDGLGITTMYVNGTSAGSYSGKWTRADGPISINSYPYGFSYRFVDFAIEEFRVSSIARSADWVTATFQNQNAPKGFVTVGPELH